MTRYVHKGSGANYTTGALVLTMIVLIVGAWVVAGAVAAIPAFFGAASASVWVWAILGGMWTGMLGKGLQMYRRESTKIEE